MKLVELLAVKGALVNKGQQTKRHELGDVWELNFTEISEALDSVPAFCLEQNIPWVLCSQKLPIGQEQVIVSCHDTSGDTPFDYTSCGWVTTDGEYWIIDNEINPYVVAWAPFPKPYKVKNE